MQQAECMIECRLPLKKIMVVFFERFRPYMLLFACSFALVQAEAQEFSWKDYNVVWNTQSKNSSESMPVGGGDIGLNVWAENGDLFFYLGKSGAFDEDNMLLKLGRVRLTLYPNPFAGENFHQELHVENGHVVLSANNNGIKADVAIWVDVFQPNIYVEVQSNKKMHVETAYESWRYTELFPQKRENNANSWKWAPPKPVVTYPDSVFLKGKDLVFFHRNRDTTAFDIVVEQQGLTSIKDSLFNPLKDLTSGGMIKGDKFVFAGKKAGRYMDTDFESWVMKSVSPARKHQLQVALHVAQTRKYADWESELLAIVYKGVSATEAKQRTQKWWSDFWKRSYIVIHPDHKNPADEAWQVGRNYQLFRYMLGCNAYGEYPTKFNGGLFTYDPSTIDSAFLFTPDFRNWGGGTHTAQNQRLVYWPMLKSGDFDMMHAQFKFYQRILKNAEWRSKFYWGHGGASFTEQIENFGLPNPAEYNWKRPEYFDKGLEYNAWLEYQWDTVLEFCMMMLELDNYKGEDISSYIPLIESCLRFFDEHYQYRAKQLGNKVLNENGHLVFYPGSSAETYKMAYNASTTVAALQEVTKRLLSVSAKYLSTEQQTYFEEFLKKIPPLPTRTSDGKKMLAPAEVWARINNTEAPQLYPVYPWGIYGIGKQDLDIAINTYTYDPDVLKFRSHVGWKQDNIFAARLGLTEEAQQYTTLKLKDSERRFPTFWGPGFDWVPDHNWGGSGMIGLQEMLMQVQGDKIYLLPAWPKEWDVDFRLHAPKNTVVTGRYRDGELLDLDVFPAKRQKDVQVMKK